jgi:hypothetical protein
MNTATAKVNIMILENENAIKYSKGDYFLIIDAKRTNQEISAPHTSAYNRCGPIVYSSPAFKFVEKRT